MGWLSELVKNTNQESTEEWSTQRRLEGCGARKNGSRGHGKVGLVGDLEKEQRVWGHREERQ